MYLWDLDHGFAGVILIKKAGDGSKKIKGCWDSIHVVEVQVSKHRLCLVWWWSLLAEGEFGFGLISLGRSAQIRVNGGVSLCFSLHVCFNTD